jgi:uncharacterized membrane protein YgcG
MKAKLFQRCGLAVLLAIIPLFGGCDQERANSAPVTNVLTSQPPAEAAGFDTNQPVPTPAEQATQDELANAPGKIISTPETASTNVSNNPRLGDFVKLVQAGLGDSVLMAYVTNSPTAFNLSSDDILYLNDLGTPEPVVTAMLQRDQQFNSTAATAPGPAPAQPQPPPGYDTSANPAPAPPTMDAYTDQNMAPQAAEAVPPLTPSPAIEADVEQAPNTSYSYFYDSLSPYGNWVDIEGYGPCWQPTAVAVNPGWSPYCDHGHWAYTDCGWCWVSDYSWGWAPFHYGRWFQHGRFGWCWAPDTVWGPAWVSWRYNNSYCGWAPLPPTACYRPGFGFTYFGQSVGFGFNFGLSASWYVFVPVDHFHDRAVDRYRMPHREVTKIYAGTTVHNQIIRGNNNLLINRGIPVDRVAAATHTQIHPIHVRADASAPRSAQLDRDGRSLAVFRPALPAPRPSNNSRLVGEGVQPNPNFNLHARVERTTAPRTPAVTSGPEHRPIIGNPTTTGRGQNWQDNRFAQPGNERQNPAQSSPPNLRHGPVFQPQTPGQQRNEQNLNSTAPENNRRTFAQPGQPQPTQPAPRQQLPPPTFNRPANDLHGNGAQPQQRQFQQPSFQQPAQVTPAPRQEAPPRTYEAPRETPHNQQNFNSGFRPEPAAPPQRSIESRPAPEVRSAPPQYSAPAHQENNAVRSGGGGGGGNGNGNNNGNSGGGGGGGGRNR